MCGILGIINVESQRSIDRDLLRQMADTMVHRGPDDSGVWVESDGQVGLAHRRLSIMDLSSAGRQPMASNDGNVFVVFNGEIYNYPELRTQFEAEGARFRSHADTEIILHLYQRHGDSFVEHLDGDFGIGLWDRKFGKLVLARDRAGVKPVYYTYFDGKFIFASEIKALMRYPGIDKSIDPVAFYHYLSYLVAPPPSTLVSGVSKLETASVLFLEVGKGPQFDVRKYWEPVPNVGTSRSFESLDEELDHLYTVSVRKRLMSDVPVGVLFSGGVDSSLNAAAFKKLIEPDKVKTFTVGMDNAGDFHDDSLVARRMAKQIGTDHHEIRISEDDLLTATVNLAGMQDEPVSDPVAVPLYFVARHAKQCGVTVLQAGEGADELFCGYDNYRRFLRHHKRFWRPLTRLPRAVGKLGGAMLEASSAPRLRKIQDVLSRYSKGQELFMSSAIAYYEMEKARILTTDARAKFDSLDSFAVADRYYRRLEELRPEASVLQKITFIELQLRLPELLLMRADKMSMANSVELRVPFLDRDLMSFAMSVPDSYKLRDGVSKEPIKRLASRYVPREEIYRPKTGFGVPIKHWFRGKLGASLKEMLSDDAGSVTDYIDASEIKARVDRGPRTTNEAFQLWVVYNVLAWKSSL